MAQKDFTKLSNEELLDKFYRTSAISASKPKSKSLKKTAANLKKEALKRME